MFFFYNFYMTIRAVSAKELGIEGGSCGTSGDVRDIDQGMAFSLGEIMAGYDFVHNAVVPGFLLHTIVGNDMPRVLMPDGKMVTGSPDQDRRWQFCDEIAQMFAEQYDGIYFQSGFGAENTSMQFEDFLNGLRRCVPNWLKYGKRTDTKTWNLFASCAGKNNANAFATLAKDGKYLRHVGVGRTRDGLTNAVSSDGIIGPVCIGDDEHGTYFGPKGVRYGINLRVNLDKEFGWSHVHVPSRELSVMLDIWGGFNDGSDPDRAITRFVSAQNIEPCARRRYDWSVSTFDGDGRTTNNGEPVHKMRLSLASPSRVWFPEVGQRQDGARGVKQNPPWTTYALLQKLRPVADRIAIALERNKNAQKVVKAAAYERCVRDMGLD